MPSFPQTLPHEEVLKRVRRLDASGRSLYQLCPAKFYMRYVLGLELIGEEGQGSWARDYGSGIHAGMEHEDIEDAVNAFHTVYDLAGKGPTAEQVEDARGAPYANRSKAHIHAPDRGEAMLRGYWEKYRKHNAFVTLHMERKLTMPMMLARGPGYTYYGTIDRVMTWADDPDGPKLTADYKTTGSNSGAAGMITNPFPQQEGYVVLALHNGLISPADTHEFIIDVLMKDSTIAGKKYKDGSAFERCHESRTAEQLEHWREETVAWWERIIDSANSECWPASAPDACRAWNTPCIYLPICRARGNEREQRALLTVGANDLYEEQPWAPLEGFEV